MRVVLTDRLSHTAEFERHLKTAAPTAEFRRWPLADPSWDYDLLVSWILPDDLVSLPPSLKAIFCFGAGSDQLLADPRIPMNMPIARLEDAGQADQMLNYVLHVAFAWLQNDNAYRVAQRDTTWQRPPTKVRSRDAMRVTVLGLGPLGQRVARGLAEANFKAVAWSRSTRVVPGVETHAGWDALPAAAKNADLVVNLLPLQTETRNILNARLFSGLRSGAYLVNLGRGEHLNEDDLLQALETGTIDCAWLDVFREEPLPAQHPFWLHRKIRITPHMAGVPTAAGTSASIARVIEALKRGLPLPNALR
ncbi:glyoxylate/hydroxypyruvate reductase A [Rhizobium sp. CG5]|uniref:NAD(P)-dependent oxidoreductase n=1 Tax=Rhizobium sp. CG5 TaxID=2726076 RepID=UPI0020347161|nr:NAD(P)-dependent oxidoreductase [Rhizobium sp. CG5]MCM2477718.1 glyoxylate/hydroxypyruvate reductase A [Rhizobium sp. CG5]